MKMRYEVQITKFVDGKPCELLVGNTNALDELINNMDKFVERMMPLDRPKAIKSEDNNELVIETETSEIIIGKEKIVIKTKEKD